MSGACQNIICCQLMPINHMLLFMLINQLIIYEYINVSKLLQPNHLYQKYAKRVKIKVQLQFILKGLWNITNNTRFKLSRIGIHFHYYKCTSATSCYVLCDTSSLVWYITCTIRLDNFHEPWCSTFKLWFHGSMMNLALSGFFYLVTRTVHL